MEKDMNDKIGKMINKIATITNQNPRDLKNLWYRCNRKERTRLRKSFREQIKNYKPEQIEVQTPTEG